MVGEQSHEPELEQPSVRKPMPMKLTIDARGCLVDGGEPIDCATLCDKAELFEGIAWSTPRVLDETVARARGAGRRVSLLARLRDIDTPDDLRAEWPRVSALLEGRDELRRRIEARLGWDRDPERG